jgi:hypothetical protein
MGVHGPHWLHFEPLLRLDLDTDADPGPVIHSNADPDPAYQNYADPDPQPW